MTRDHAEDGSGRSPTDDRSLATDGGADSGADGGEAAGADDVALDPWGSSTVSDYRALFEEFED
jgi:tryptophanyl-tRNA synthetase